MLGLRSNLNDGLVGRGTINGARVRSFIWGSLPRTEARSLYEVQVVIRRVGSADEDQLAALQDHIEDLGGIGVAPIYFPRDEELGICFQVKEEVLERLLQPARTSLAA